MFTVGFEQNRKRVVKVWDVRQLKEESSKSNEASCLSKLSLDTNPGIMFFEVDDDASLLYLTGRGDTGLRIYDTREEITVSPYSQEVVNKVISKKKTKSTCLLPKYALDINGCEVNRMLNLTEDSIEIIRCQVPRRRTGDIFYPELYPDTLPIENTTSVSQWMSSSDTEAKKQSVLELYNCLQGITVKREKEAVIKQEKQQQCKVKKQKQLKNLRETEMQKDQAVYKKAAKVIGYIPKLKNVTLKQAQKEETAFDLKVSASSFCLLFSLECDLVDW